VNRDALCTRVRDYKTLIARLHALPAGWRVRVVARISNYPWFVCERVVARNAPTVLLSGGMHGEEPAGVEGVLRWMEGREWKARRVNWLVFPCINPYGWERNRRRNAQRRDVNRQFRGPSGVPEAELIKRLVKERRFLFSMEFHEDVEASGYYLYELRRTPPFIGEKILRAVGKVIHINADKIIDGREATGEGLIRRSAELKEMNRRRHWPMAFHLYLHCTDHVLGSETPVDVLLEQRERAHITALRTALKLAH
jgi:protein MpaA